QKRIASGLDRCYCHAGKQLVQPVPEFGLGDCARYCFGRTERGLFIEGGTGMIWVIIIGMSLVTMIPRVIPTFIVDKLRFRDWINRWLNAIPYAALGALIFPGVLS